MIARGSPVHESQARARSATIELDAAEIAQRFKGLSSDRRPWPLEDVEIDRLCGDGGLADCALVPLSRLSPVVEYYERASREFACDLLYCQPLASWDELELRESDTLSFRGFDYGYYLGVEHHFSAVYDDVIYGAYDALRAYAGSLNDDLLLPTLQLVQDVHHVRTELIHAGGHLERAQSFIPIAISVPASRP